MLFLYRHRILATDLRKIFEQCSVSPEVNLGMRALYKYTYSIPVEQVPNHSDTVEANG